MTNPSGGRQHAYFITDFYQDAHRLGTLPAPKPHDNACMKRTPILYLTADDTDFDIVLDATKDATIRGRDAVSKKVFATTKENGQRTPREKVSTDSSSAREGGGRGGEGESSACCIAYSWLSWRTGLGS